MTVAASALCAILFLISWASSSSFPKMYISILPQLHTKFLFTEKTNLVIHREKTDIHKLLTTFKNKTNDYLCKWDVLFFNIMTTIRYEIERDLLLWFVISFTFFISWRVSQSITAFGVIYHSLLMRRLFSPMARLPGESGSALLSRLITEGLKLTLLTALEGGCNLEKKL